jgi:hypothetical protein
MISPTSTVAVPPRVAPRPQAACVSEEAVRQQAQVRLERRVQESHDVEELRDQRQVGHHVHAPSCRRSGLLRTLFVIIVFLSYV